MNYNFAQIEKKWQDIWDAKNVFAATNDYTKPKYYALVEFPYPSGKGLHVGHPRSYTALDIVARKRRMEGYNVLYPMGWDAFGLPTENFAIKNHIHPEIVTQQNINRFKSQLKSLGLSFDWNREINTTDPNYYKWTQWIFLQLFKKGLAYKKEMSVNWCTSCKCVLANEEVVGGVCERCGSEVVHKVKSQWMLKITAYAQRLIDDLEQVNYIDRVKTSQINWIGRSTGAEVDFATTAGDILTIYTTRPDTLFGATYMVISPEHPYIEQWADKISNMDAIKAYQEEAAKKSDFERTELVKDKTGVKIEGVRGINPVNGKEIPIFISDYVLMTYGTGAIMAVPAHDTRDWDFAKKFDLPIIEVVKGGHVEEEAFTDCETGMMVNSDFLDGLTVEEAKEKIKVWLEEKGKGHAKINYKLRDWVFSRQRYWGEPIPIVHCPKCGNVPVPEEELPLRLPEVESYEPTGTGESPLAAIEDWVNCKCPVCGADAKRETNTMPQWAGSSWYFLRYVDAHNDKELVSKEKADKYLPVDMYIGGVEHAVLHLLYSRFYTKFLYDIGVIDFDEPFQKLFNQGMITGKNGIKMSKSKGNVVSPDDLVRDYGCDSLRMYELFVGPPELDAEWDDRGIDGVYRFLNKFWNLVMDNKDKNVEPTKEMLKLRHKMVHLITQRLESFSLNTVVSGFMEYNNKMIEMAKKDG
ncbi:MAG: leucine--tRNA ligase, partial [Oscillospiraceae bacterium]|nr:leucine--tRNA ligase [Oscillospiraceae bacterium]